MSQTSIFTALQPYARLGANHGYSIDGDVAVLHADVELLAAPPPGNWALQLWACDAPYTGGALSGLKVAEAELAGSADTGERVMRLAADTQARVPGGQRDYAMVLVLASGEGGSFTQVLDYANYPARQRFITPHLNGSVGYAIEGDRVTLTADAVVNPRESDNLSGSLRLELWALSEPYSGGSVDGHLLGSLDVGRVAGQDSLPRFESSAPFAAPPGGEWHVAMMLREWAGPTGYVTRDYACFPVRYVVPRAVTADAAAVVEDVVALPLSPVDTVTPDGREAAASDGPTRVSINTASVEQLTAITGLSRPVAKAVVKGRPYDSFDALIAIRGIGPKLLVKLRPLLSL